MTGRVYAGVSASERREGRRDRLVAAALELFDEKGVAATTIGEVCERAGLIKRYFYESFASLDDVLQAVVAETTAAITQQVVDAAMAFDEPAAQARAALGAFVDYASEHEQAVLVLFRETLTPAGALAGQRHALTTQAVDVVRLWAALNQPEGSPPPSEAEGMIAAHALIGASGQVLLAWFEGRIEATREEILDYLGQLFASVAAIRRAPVPSRRPRRTRR